MTTAVANHDAEIADLTNAAALVREVAAHLGDSPQARALNATTGLLDDVANWLRDGHLTRPELAPDVADLVDCGPVYTAEALNAARCTAYTNGWDDALNTRQVGR